MAKWTPFPHAGAFDYTPASLKKQWARLHAGDAEPLPKDAAVLHLRIQPAQPAERRQRDAARPQRGEVARAGGQQRGDDAADERQQQQGEQGRHHGQV